MCQLLTQLHIYESCAQDQAPPTQQDLDGDLPQDDGVEEYNEDEDQEGADNDAPVVLAAPNEPEMQGCSATSVALAVEQLDRLPEKVRCQSLPCV